MYQYISQKNPMETENVIVDTAGAAQTGGEPGPHRIPVSAQRKNAIRKAVYRWRATNPDAYKALCRKSSLAYYAKHREEISERRRKEREAERYVAEQFKKEMEEQMAISL